MTPGSVRITRVECSEFGTSLTAPGHRFPTGAQVRLEGLPGLDSQTFLVEHPSGHKFSISHEISVSVKSIDPVGSIVQTERPHQLGRVHDLRLTAYDASAQAQVERFCMTGRALDESSLYLEAFSKATKTFGPAELLAEWTDGVLSTPFPTGMVVPQHAWKQYECCRGSAVVVCRPPLSEESCLREWRAALSAARELGGGTMFKTSMQAELDLHDCSRLHVQHSGWADCNGIYQRSGHLTFSLGALISITHVEELGMWCLFADVVALYPLSDHRAHMRLGNWDGPQLLYVRTGDPLGYWEPVIGPGPGPFVEVHKEVSVQQPPSTQSSCLLHPSVGSVVLDLLFNYAHASWSGGLWSGSIYGLSPLEALVSALELWGHLRMCSAVCRSWHEALEPFRSLTGMFRKALRIPKASQPLLPSVQEVVRAILLFGRLRKDALSVPSMMIFRRHTWPAHVSAIDISSELSPEDDVCENPASSLLEGKATAFSQFARRVLRGLPLPWKASSFMPGYRKQGDGRRFAWFQLLDFHRPDRPPTAYVSTDTQGHMELRLPGGSRALPHSADALGPLAAQGLRQTKQSRSWVCCWKEPRSPNDPCGRFACGGPASPCYACKRDKEGRRQLGFSQLQAGYALEFQTTSGSKISFEIEVTVLPFFSTSKDPQLVDHAKELLRGMQEGDSSPEIDDSSPGIHADEESAESNDVLSGLSSEDDQPNDETDAEIDAEDGQPE